MFAKRGRWFWFTAAFLAALGLVIGFWVGNGHPAGLNCEPLVVLEPLRGGVNVLCIKGVDKAVEVREGLYLFIVGPP
ncbi:MAG: hypothetical protein A2117_01240 [Candidatus Wildermuthbacteria bacterium GWA2_46_15]|uniref:Uncharacterized protein n=1 Tax=Candidatus Wildermuthbacteria bacterium GWA2_46_15 TaxID=1802443 RepID=A0A1G2QPL7_9BACT|nr:MAG: hypothetical protein A2117_01240 [Candidatus Wildermuthbacteria bacterium GWA2_46_15]